MLLFNLNHPDEKASLIAFSILPNLKMHLFLSCFSIAPFWKSRHVLPIPFSTVLKLYFLSLLVTDKVFSQWFCSHLSRGRYFYCSDFVLAFLEDSVVSEMLWNCMGIYTQRIVLLIFGFQICYSWDLFENENGY